MIIALVCKNLTCNPFRTDDFCLMFCFLYKVLNGNINIDISPFIQFYSDSNRYSLRGRDDCVLKKNYARTDIFKFRLFNRIADMWNALPLSTRCDPRRE